MIFISPHSPRHIIMIFSKNKHTINRSSSPSTLWNHSYILVDTFIDSLPALIYRNKVYYLEVKSSFGPRRSVASLQCCIVVLVTLECCMNYSEGDSCHNSWDKRWSLMVPTILSLLLYMSAHDFHTF